MERHFQLEGIDYYVTAPNKELAAWFCQKHKWGVMPENLVEIERIPPHPEHFINYYDEYGIEAGTEGWS